MLTNRGVRLANSLGMPADQRTPVPYYKGSEWTDSLPLSTLAPAKTMDADGYEKESAASPSPALVAPILPRR